MFLRCVHTVCNSHPWILNSVVNIIVWTHPSLGRGGGLRVLFKQFLNLLDKFLTDYESNICDRCHAFTFVLHFSYPTSMLFHLATCMAPSSCLMCIWCADQTPGTRTSYIKCLHGEYPHSHQQFSGHYEHKGYKKQPQILGNVITFCGFLLDVNENDIARSMRKRYELREAWKNKMKCQLQFAFVEGLSYRKCVVCLRSDVQAIPERLRA